MYIWNPHHLDKTIRFRISRYIPVYPGMRFSYRLVPAYTAIYQTGMVYTFIYCIKEMMVFLSLGLCFPVESCLYTLPTYSTTHSGASSAKQSMFYPVELKLGTYMYIQVYTFMIMYTKVYTPIYSYKKASTTFHFESGLIRLALPASFPSTLEPFISAHQLSICRNTPTF